jgi:hypothetical protein
MVYIPDQLAKASARSQYLCNTMNVPNYWHSINQQYQKLSSSLEIVLD